MEVPDLATDVAAMLVIFGVVVKSPGADPNLAVAAVSGLGGYRIRKHGGGGGT